MDSAVFEYPPLNHKRQIRLLDVFIPEDSTDLHGSYEVVWLDRILTEYNAISYHWDRTLPEQKIWLGSSRYITINGAAASALRWVVRSGAIGRIWLDQLCINQNDLDEKALRIRLMTDIFASADQVNAWLGDASDDSDGALQLANSLAIQSSKPEPNPANLWRAVQSSRSTINALARLLERPWFSRIWILQEVVLARSCLMVCGDSSISFDYMKSVLFAFRKYGLLDMLRTGSSVHGAFPSIGGSVFCMADYRERRHRLQPILILDALKYCCRTLTTDPRDKVFALLGMVSDVNAKEFDPDYRASPEQIYARTTAYLIESYGVLDLLHCAGVGHLRNLSDLPSWVPDWSAFEPYTCVNIFEVVKELGCRAGGKTMPFITGTSPSILALKGHLIDYVDCMLPPDPVTQQDVHYAYEASNAVAVASWCEAAAALFAKLQPYPTQEDWSEVLWRTLQANVCLKNAPATRAGSDGRRDFICWLARLREYMPLDQVDFFHYPLLQILLTEATDETWETIPGGAASFRVSRDGFKTYRVFSTTSGYVGLAPPFVESYDVLCIFHGGATPFVLRPTSMDGMYQLVGECYVHGLMNGEGLELGHEQLITLV